MRITISSKDFKELPKLMLEQTGEISLSFKVVGANIFDDTAYEGDTEETKEYTLECQVLEIDDNKMDLKESLSRAEALMVKTTTQPFPG